MADIKIDPDELPKVTVGEQGWMSCDSVSFSPATSLKLARLWAMRYLAIAEHLEAEEELASQNSDTDRVLARNSRELFGKGYSKLNDKEREIVTTVYDLQVKAGEVPEVEKPVEPADTDAMVVKESAPTRT